MLRWKLLIIVLISVISCQQQPRSSRISRQNTTPFPTPNRSILKTSVSSWNSPSPPKRSTPSPIQSLLNSNNQSFDLRFGNSSPSSTGNDQGVTAPYQQGSQGIQGGYQGGSLNGGGYQGLSSNGGGFQGQMGQSSVIGGYQGAQAQGNPSISIYPGGQQQQGGLVYLQAPPQPQGGYLIPQPQPQPQPQPGPTYPVLPPPPSPLHPQYPTNPFNPIVIGHGVYPVPKAPQYTHAQGYRRVTCKCCCREEVVTPRFRVNCIQPPPQPSCDCSRVSCSQPQPPPPPPQPGCANIIGQRGCETPTYPLPIPQPYPQPSDCRYRPFDPDCNRVPQLSIGSQWPQGSQGSQGSQGAQGPPSIPASSYNLPQTGPSPDGRQGIDPSYQEGPINPSTPYPYPSTDYPITSSVYPETSTKSSSSTVVFSSVLALIIVTSLLG